MIQNAHPRALPHHTIPFLPPSPYLRNLSPENTNPSSSEPILSDATAYCVPIPTACQEHRVSARAAKAVKQITINQLTTWTLHSDDSKAHGTAHALQTAPRLLGGWPEGKLEASRLAAITRAMCKQDRKMSGEKTQAQASIPRSFLGKCPEARIHSPSHPPAITS